MSLSGLETSLLATFDSIWEMDDIAFVDNESEISRPDNQPLVSMPSNAGICLTDLSNTNSPQERVTTGSSASFQTGNIDETNHDTAAKKLTKKRKSWGEELPIPTTNLPPRKRAKTEAEKEQRRIERVLRNRAAAHSSRERKRKEVESLAIDTARLSESNTVLKAQLDAQEAANHELRTELEAMMQTLYRYEECLKVESRGIFSGVIVSHREASEPSPNSDEDLFQFLVDDSAAQASDLDPSIHDWRDALGTRESVTGLDYIS
ncbi:hypothetical protein HOY82DRAFT_636506 [Tuber indicum]|nr:hypothetical protein HOY82DRAFT_636506 [Tuber indicum]